MNITSRLIIFMTLFLTTVVGYAACPGHVNYTKNILQVERIEFGKDGYMAYLQDDDQRIYEMIVSMVNLEANYISLKSGDKVTVKGDFLVQENTIISIFPEKILKLGSS